MICIALATVIALIIGAAIALIWWFNRELVIADRRDDHGI